MFTAIYARQSIEKQDSVSIEAQVESCRKVCEINGWEYQIYKDAGYSGKDTQRPDFEKMIRDLENGRISRVISYRLDRISRSISDFAGLIQLFEKYNVHFMSATENFDTKSPLGRAMVYIVMVFAQLERETIVQRVTDNYFFRAKQGRFMGGNCPYGYYNIKTDSEGKQKAILAIDNERSSIVKEVFSMFNENFPIYQIVLTMNERKFPAINSSSWTSTKVRRILSNPVYAANTIEIYEYFKNKGYKIANSPMEFTGDNGLFLFAKEKGRKNRSYKDISDQVLAIGEHSPIIPAEQWLKAQYRMSRNTRPPRTGTSRKTWLTGLLKCGNCSFAITTRSTVKGGTEYAYFTCRGHSSRGSSVCTNDLFLSCREIENEIERYLFDKINSLEFHEGIDQQENPSEYAIERNKLLARVHELDIEIQNFLSQIGKGSSVVDSYIGRQIEELDRKKQALLAQIDEINLEMSKRENSLSTGNLKKLSERIKSTWHTSSVAQKQSMVSNLIKSVKINSDREMAIEWFI